MPTKSTMLLLAIRAALGLEAALALAGGLGPVAFVSLAALGLTFVPGLVASRVGLRLPQSFLAAIALFVLSTLYLGEVRQFYDRLWWWDLAMHMGSAMGFGILGFLLVLMLFEGDRYAAPPWAMAALSFCLAITVGTLWEVFEFAMDSLFGFNMLKSGLPDTFGDLIVNAFGAAGAALAGLVYLTGRAQGTLRAPFDAFIASNRSRFHKLFAPRRRRRALAGKGLSVDLQVDRPGLTGDQVAGGEDDDQNHQVDGQKQAKG